MIFSFVMMWDPIYFVFIAPAVILGLWAQWRVKANYSKGQKVPVNITGAEAARRMLDDSGLHQVGIEMVGGVMTDHYDPRDKVLRLSHDVYYGRDCSAVGIAAHEAGHALQDATNYAPLVVRNLAVPAANFGGSISMTLLVLGVIFSFAPLLLAGIALFSCVVFFQVVNLPVEFNASSRAKDELAMLGIVNDEQAYYVKKVLSAAAMTYVAATLQTILTLLYYIMRFSQSRD